MADTVAGIAPQTDTYANWVIANPTLGKDSGGKSFSQFIFATASPVGTILIWGNDQTFTTAYAAKQYIVTSANTVLSSYSTGWLLNEIGGAGVGDWTNVHLGDDPTGDDNVTHGLGAPLCDLIVKLFLSTDGTDANSFQVDAVVGDNVASSVRSLGYSVFHVDNNNITIQTGRSGLQSIIADGASVQLDNEDYYYKVKVYYFT